MTSSCVAGTYCPTSLLIFRDAHFTTQAEVLSDTTRPEVFCGSPGSREVDLSSCCVNGPMTLTQLGKPCGDEKSFPSVMHSACGPPRGLTGMLVGAMLDEFATLTMKSETLAIDMAFFHDEGRNAVDMAMFLQ